MPRADFVVWADGTNLPQFADYASHAMGHVSLRESLQAAAVDAQSDAVSALKSLPTVATNIRAARVAAHLTQEELADAVGVTRTRISDWETGRHEPSRKHLDMLCRVLGRTRGWFADPHGRNDPEDTP